MSDGWTSDGGIMLCTVLKVGLTVVYFFECKIFLKHICDWSLLTETEYIALNRLFIDSLWSTYV